MAYFFTISLVCQVLIWGTKQRESWIILLAKYSDGKPQVIFCKNELKTISKTSSFNSKDCVIESTKAISQNIGSDLIQLWQGFRHADAELQGGQFSDSNTRTLLEESTSSNNRYYCCE
jgi:hypothetical protein